MNWTQQRIAQLMKTLEKFALGSLVLDAGCGNGQFTTLLAEQSFKSVGIDISIIPLNVEPQKID